MRLLQAGATAIQPMRFYWHWTYGQIPVLAHLKPGDRRRVWQRASWRAKRDWRMWFSFSVTAVCVALAMHLAPLHPVWIFLLYLAVGAMVGEFISYQFRFRAILPHLREELRENCPHCGYDIRATPDRCPDCGTVRSRGDAAAA